MLLAPYFIFIFTRVRLLAGCWPRQVRIIYIFPRGVQTSIFKDNEGNIILKGGGGLYLKLVVEMMKACLVPYL